jgi:hypothetical protein
MTALESAALERWRERELTYPKFTRRMTPDALDMASGAWALNVLATKLAMEAADLMRDGEPGAAIMIRLGDDGQPKVERVNLYADRASEVRDNPKVEERGNG